MYKPKPSDD